MKYEQQRVGISVCSPQCDETHRVCATPSDMVKTPASSAIAMQVLRLSSICLSVLDRETLHNDLMQNVVEALPSVQAGVLWLYERHTGKLRVASLYGLPLKPALLAAFEYCLLSTGETLVGQVFQRNEQVSLVEKRNCLPALGTISERNAALLNDINQYMPQTIGIDCFPLRADNEVLGVIQLMTFFAAEDDSSDTSRDSACQEGCFPPYEQDIDSSEKTEILLFLASFIARAVKNVQRNETYRLYRHRLNAFNAVVTAISSATDLQNLMDSVLDVVLDFLPVSSGAIFLLDPAQALLKIGAHRGVPEEYVTVSRRFAVDGCACEEVIRYAQPVVRPLIEERGEHTLLQAGVESCAYLPLLVGGTVVGVLGVYGGALLHKQIDMESLMPLSNQIGFAIANVRLYEDSKLERQKLNTVINSIAEGVVLCDSKGRLILANEAAMLLLSLESLPFQQPLSEMVDFYGIRDLEGGTLPVEHLPMARALSGEIFHDYRVLLHGASGSNSVMSFSGAPTLADDGKTIEGAVVIFRDITARQRLERAKDEFLAVAAHELRSPLASVRSYSDMLLKREQQRDDANPRDVRGLAILSQQVTHMLRMVDNLLDVSRIDAGQIGLHIQKVNLVSLTSQVLDQNRLTVMNREFLLNTDYAELFVSCDSMRIRQVLTNLVGNGIKYSPAETPISVDIMVVESSLLHIEPQNNGNDVPLDMPLQEILVRVSDKGSMIPPEQQEQLFKRYARMGGRRIEGLGLGLYLCRQFVLMHGGRIWIESVEGVGNTFCFTLPMNPMET